MKLAIAGSRNITNFDISPYIPMDTDVIISGVPTGSIRLLSNMQTHTVYPNISFAHAMISGNVPHR